MLCEFIFIIIIITAVLDACVWEEYTPQAVKDENLVCGLMMTMLCNRINVCECVLILSLCIYQQLIGSTDMPAPLSEAEGNCGIPAPSGAAVAVNDVPRNMDTLLNKSTVPLKKGRSVKKASKSSRSVKSASKPST